jgi:hypothetical protein
VAADSDIPELYLGAGIAAAPLISQPGKWINRRVETVQLLAQEETRRQVSIDFTLSHAQRAELVVEHGVVVPISVMTKEARRNFDLRDESGSSVPVLGKAINGRLAHAAVMGEVFDAAGGNPGKAEQGDSLWSIAWGSQMCRRMLEMLQHNYVLFAVIDQDSANRRILKYSFGEDFRFDKEVTASIRERLSPSAVLDRIWQPGRQTFQLLCTGAWRAESFHFEVVIPEELRVHMAVLYDFGRERVLSMPERNRNRASLYLESAMTPELDVDALVVIAPERRGRTLQAAVTGTIVSALLWLGVLSGLDFSNPDAPGASASIVLAGAALYSGITAAQGEPSLVSQVFSTSRFLLWCISLCALAASATLGMEVPSAKPLTVWVWAAAAATLAAAWLVWGAVRAPGNLRKENAAKGSD